MKNRNAETPKRQNGINPSLLVTRYTLLLLLASPTFAQAPATQPASDRHPDPKIDAILTRLETKGNALNDLEADVMYGNEETLVGANVVRFGKIWVLRGPPDAKGERKGKFLVHFYKVHTDEESANESEYYLFDGEFLITRKDKTKLARKQKLMEAGQNLDPFKLDGPFPVPFGARKSEMLATFDISRTPPAGLTNLPPASQPAPGQPAADVLWLTPKPGSKLARDIRCLYVLIDPASDLPLRVISYEQQDKIKRAIFSKVKVNTGLPAGLFVLEIPSDYQFDDQTKR